MSHRGHSLEESYSSAGMQSVYSAAPADWATRTLVWGVLLLSKIQRCSRCILLSQPTESKKSKCSLGKDRNETVNNTISEYSKLVEKEYKTRHDWVGKVIHWWLGKRLKLYHAYKWYMQKSESVQENEMIKILSCLQVVYAKIRIYPREWDD